MAEDKLNKVMNMSQEEIAQSVDMMSEEDLHYIAQHFLMGSFDGGDRPKKDADGFVEGAPIDMGMSDEKLTNLQALCWNKFMGNPQLRSYVRDYAGMLTGKDFEISSENREIESVVKKVTNDIRNELYSNMTKYAARSEIEGELHLMLTVHPDGFVEVDFISPSAIKGGEGNSGIFFHPKKSTMPLVYEVHFDDEDSTQNTESCYVPSVYVAYLDDVLKDIVDVNFDEGKLEFSKASGNDYAPLKGFKRFMVRWDKGLLRKRNFSHIVATLQWLDKYESLKNWEILHKKSSGSYLWVVEISDTKAFKTWLSLTDKQKQDTGLYGDKTPGGMVILPPGLALQCRNPTLPKISDSDSDIMQMAISGLNTTDHALTGKTQGSTFAGIKETGKTATDRAQNEIAYFERFLRFDFWRHILYFSACMSKNVKHSYKKKEAVDFDESGQPVFEEVEYDAYELIDITFPSSEVSDITSKATAYLGSKHAALPDSLGISHATVAKKLGFPNYKKQRLIKATEDKMFPDLLTAEESEAAVENSVEPGKNKEENDSEE